MLTACRGATSPQGWASPQFSDSTLLASPNHKTLAAVDLQANAREWTFPPSKSTISLTALYGTPAVSQQTVFLGGYDNSLYALNLSDGNQKWAGKTHGHIVGGPVTDSTNVYVGSADRCLYAFAISDGSQPYSAFCTGDKIWSTPVVSGGVVYFGSMDKKMYAIDASTGRSHWDVPFQSDGAFASIPVVDSGTVYVGSFDKYMYALDASTGQQRWRFPVDDWIWNKALVSGGTVYFGSLSGKVYAVNASDGKLAWSKAFQATGVVRGGPAIFGTTLVVATSEGNVYGLNASTGEKNWTSKASAGVLSDLVVNGGMIYYSTKSGAVQKVDPTDGTITDVTIPQ